MQNSMFEEYLFHRQKIPKDFTYPIKRNELESVLSDFPDDLFFGLSFGGISLAYSTSPKLRWEKKYFLRLRYAGGDYKPHAAWRTSVSLYGLHRKEMITQEMKDAALAAMVTFFRKVQAASPSWRDQDHYWSAFLTTDGKIGIEET
jgi:hypothetical protein